MKKIYIVFVAALFSFLNLSAQTPNKYWWECVPGVIRDDGVEVFRLEVSVNGPVKSVIATDIDQPIIPPIRPPFNLRDDGTEGDVVAGDFVFTMGGFRYNIAYPLPEYYESDSNSPYGLNIRRICSIQIRQNNGSIFQFVDPPQIGILNSSLPFADVNVRSSSFQTTSHMMNVVSFGNETQRFLHMGDVSSIEKLAKKIYSVMPDIFDFFMFFSSYKMEAVGGANFVAGRHVSTQNDVDGIGSARFNNSAAYGSAGRLLGINALDTYRRGILSVFATHEIQHQWSAYLGQLGITDGTGHYSANSNIGSLLGGYAWKNNGDGTFKRDCNIGPGGAYQAPSLDKYLMGLIEGREVTPLLVSKNNEPFDCDQVFTRYDTVTIEDIQKVHGVRTPSPNNAQRHFRIGFVIESRRFLNQTEMTFYNILAEHYTSLVPTGEPDPYVGQNWAPVTRFFGSGVSWASDVPLKTSVISQKDPIVLNDFALHQNYPNPFNPATTISFALPKDGRVTLKIYNVVGQVVATLVDGEMKVGKHSVVWNASQQPSGFYFAHIEVNGVVQTRKLILQK